MVNTFPDLFRHICMSLVSTVFHMKLSFFLSFFLYCLLGFFIFFLECFLSFVLSFFFNSFFLSILCLPCSSLGRCTFQTLFEISFFMVFTRNFFKGRKSRKNEGKIFFKGFAPKHWSTLLFPEKTLNLNQHLSASQKKPFCLFFPFHTKKVIKLYFVQRFDCSPRGWSKYTTHITYYPVSQICAGLGKMDGTKKWERRKWSE